MIKIKTFKNEADWLEARRGKITGTRLGDLVDKKGGGKKIGFYETLAERIAIPATGENPMDRGKRIEVEALERFEKETKKKVNKDLVMWEHEEYPDIAISPDGFIGKTKITEACEVKCLNSARHLEALLTGGIPSEYQYQVLQYFIVNPDLKKLYFIFYDPRIPNKDMFYHTVNRKDKVSEIEALFEIEKKALIEFGDIEALLVF